MNLHIIIDFVNDVDSQDADEILNAYGYGTSIPSNAKRRLQQSLKLARR